MNTPDIARRLLRSSTPPQRMPSTTAHMIQDPTGDYIGATTLTVGTYSNTPHYAIISGRIGTYGTGYYATDPVVRAEHRARAPQRLAAKRLAAKLPPIDLSKGPF